jgi:hypothetical protein
LDHHRRPQLRLGQAERKKVTGCTSDAVVVVGADEVGVVADATDGSYFRYCQEKKETGVVKTV